MSEKDLSNHKNIMKLKKSTILNVPFQQYEKDFIFNVNGKDYQTNRIVADLISKKISDFHSTDPTINSFIITTDEQGDFSRILKLIEFQENEIPESELPFINEVINLLEIRYLDFQIANESKELNITNIFKNIQQHEKSEFFSKWLEKDIQFLSSHFYEINESKEEEIEEINRIKKSTFERIISDPNLRIKSEDQLLRIINYLYKNDYSYSSMYDYVCFCNLKEESIEEFIDLFDKEDMTCETWRQITRRLLNNKNESFNETNQSKRYSISNIISDEKTKGIEIAFIEGKNEFDGIINYIRKQSKPSIENEINLSCSSKSSGYVSNIIQYENTQNFFYTKNLPNSWICIEFKNNKIIPSHYTIRTFPGTAYHPKSWIIECSNNESNWEKIDEQTNCNLMNVDGVFHTFQIDYKNKQKKPFKYFRIKQTGQNWHGSYNLVLNAIEIHGTLI